MKFNLWSINYAPEETGIGKYNTLLAEFLAQKNHDIRIISSFAYYPTWKKKSEDKGLLFRTDCINHIPVHRCWHFVPKQPSTLKRIFHELSFVCTSFVRQLFLPAPDLYIIVSPPLLLGLAAIVIGFIKRRPFLFHIQDLQPDAALELGMVQKNSMIKILYLLESIAYKNAIKVSCISQSMLEALHKKGVPNSKQIYFPNPTDPIKIKYKDNYTDFRSTHQIPHDHLLASYSGNIGIKQGLEILVDAAKELKDTPITILICGEGSYRSTLESLISRESELPIQLLPLLPIEEYHSMLATADVCLITQRHHAGQFCFPSKLSSVVSLGKPVIAVADHSSDLYLAVHGGNFGTTSSPNKPDELVQLLTDLASNRSKLKEWQRNSFRFAKQFDIEKVLNDFEKELLDIVHFYQT